MQELPSILLAHARAYPHMEPRDAVKLIYQNEFGGGHLITDENACRARLRAEYAATAQSAEIPLLEPLGNHIFRVNLAALNAWGYEPDSLAGDFICSASLHRGTMASFLKKLELLQSMAENGKMPFCADALEAFLESYAAAGYPAVSHSEVYRRHYQPAYRVVDGQCLPDHIQKHRML